MIYFINFIIHFNLINILDLIDYNLEIFNGGIYFHISFEDLIYYFYFKIYININKNIIHCIHIKLNKSKIMRQFVQGKLSPPV